MPPAPELAALSLAEIAAYAAQRKLPPVERWHPAHCGDSEMRIARDGTWFHQGSPIGRPDMVRLFSTILRREPDGGHVLVTPAEKLDIAVEDAPFVAVELRVDGAGADATLTFRLNTGDLVTAGPDHPLRFVEGDDGPRPYLHVRGDAGGGLAALVGRAIYYELAELALAHDPPVLWSAGACFPPAAMTLAGRLRAALAAGLARAEDIRPGDAPWTDHGIDAAVAEPTPAAVLIAVTDRPEPGVILTQRPDTMRRHPGQVAFPGGRCDPGETAIAAALREAQEEVALDPALVDVVGVADPYRTGTGYRIVPVLAVIPPDLPLIPSEAEVAAVFEVPLGWLLDPANHGVGSLVFQGATRHFVEMHWHDRRIWGATAAMTVNLSRRLAWPRA